MDVNGRVYCGCGASFCMNLERKLAASQTKSSGTTKPVSYTHLTLPTKA